MNPTVRDADEWRLDVRLKAAVDAYAAGERGVPLDEAFAQILEQARKHPARICLPDLH